MKKPAGFFTYFYHSALINHLTDEQAGRLYKALLLYGDEDIESDLSDDQSCMLAFLIFKNDIDRNFERYAEACENKSKAAKLREAKKHEDNNE